MIAVYSDLEALSHAAADLVATTAVAAVAARGSFSFVLSGGGTPKRTFELLATAPYRARMPWAKTHIYWSDERCVPADNERSNYRMARLALLDHVPIPKEQIHPMLGALPPAEGAQQYEDLLRAVRGGVMPQFDLLILGLGDNGHTASLFPQTPVLAERQRWVASAHPKGEEPRLTFTVPLLNAGKTLAFLVSGAGKASVLREVIDGPSDPQRLPAQLVQPTSGDLRWLLDRAAAAALSDKSLKR